MEWAEGYDDTTGAKVCSADNGIFDFDFEVEHDIPYTLDAFVKFYLKDPEADPEVSAPMRTLWSHIMDEEPEVSQEAEATKKREPAKIEYQIVSHIVMESPEINATIKTQFVREAATVFKSAAAMTLAFLMAYWSILGVKVCEMKTCIV